MTKVVMMADRKTKPPNTPSAMIPPGGGKLHRNINYIERRKRIIIIERT